MVQSPAERFQIQNFKFQMGTKPDPGPNIRTEFVAGVTTFFTMAYIVVVNPAILSTEGTGMPFSGVLTADGSDFGLHGPVLPAVPLRRAAGGMVPPYATAAVLVGKVRVRRRAALTPAAV
jgi:hypothetical protein